MPTTTAGPRAARQRPGRPDVTGPGPRVTGSSGVRRRPPRRPGLRRPPDGTVCTTRNFTARVRVRDGAGHPEGEGLPRRQAGQAHHPHAVLDSDQRPRPARRAVTGSRWSRSTAAGNRSVTRRRFGRCALALPGSALHGLSRSEQVTGWQVLARRRSRCSRPLRCRRRRAPSRSPPAACASPMGARSPTGPTRSDRAPSGGCRSRSLAAGRPDPLPHRGRVPRGLPGPAPRDRPRAGAPGCGSASRCARTGARGGSGASALGPLYRVRTRLVVDRRRLRATLYRSGPADLAVTDRCRDAEHAHAGGPLLDPREVPGGRTRADRTGRGRSAPAPTRCSATGPAAA